MCALHTNRIIMRKNKKKIQSIRINLDTMAVVIQVDVYQYMREKNINQTHTKIFSKVFSQTNKLLLLLSKTQNIQPIRMTYDIYR